MHIPSWSDLASAATVVGVVVSLLRIDFITRSVRSQVVINKENIQLRATIVEDAAVIAKLQRSNTAGDLAGTNFEHLLAALDGKVDQLQSDLNVAQAGLSNMTIQLNSVTTKFTDGIAWMCEAIASHETGASLPELPESVKPDVMVALEKRRPLLGA